MGVARIHSTIAPEHYESSLQMGPVDWSAGGSTLEMILPGVSQDAWDGGLGSFGSARRVDREV